MRRIASLPWLFALALVLGFGACKPRAGTQPRSPDAGETAKPRARTKSPARTGDKQARGLLLRGGRVMTAAGVTYDRGDVLIVGGEVRAVGPKVNAPKGAKIVDVSGKTVTPGIIDTHSHIGVYASPGLKAHADGNEAVAPTTPQVRAADGYWPQDPQIERARAGGVTSMQILPGSANLIGGRSITVKTYPRARSAEDARFVGAPDGLKMACGENPKRVYAEKGGPSTRMGNIAGFRAAFQKALEYQQKWERYRVKLRKYGEKQERKAKRKGKRRRRSGDDEDDDDDNGKDKDDDPPEPPERDFGLDTLVGVLEGRILVHNHCYRADEMSIMMGLAERYGFRIRSFHHAVEAYKIADRLAAHGAAASVWADWWGFKAEAYDGVRENAAMVSVAGARAIIHSDSGVGIQRLNQEAAKAMFAGRRAGLDVTDDEALRWVTANPAWALGVDAWVGTLEKGKQADVVVWSGSPFSVYSKAVQVYIEGELVFDLAKPSARPRSDFEVGHRPGDLGQGAAP